MRGVHAWAEPPPPIRARARRWAGQRKAAARDDDSPRVRYSPIVKLATISTVSLIAGGVLVAGGIVLIVIAPRTADKSSALAHLLSGTF